MLLTSTTPRRCTIHQISFMTGGVVKKSLPFDIDADVANLPVLRDGKSRLYRNLLNPNLDEEGDPKSFCLTYSKFQGISENPKDSNIIKVHIRNK